MLRYAPRRKEHDRGYADQADGDRLIVHGSVSGQRAALPVDICVAVAATLVLALALGLRYEPLQGIGGVAAWLLLVPAPVLLAARWRLRGALAGIAASLLLIGLIEGVGHGWDNVADESTRGTLVLTGALIVTVPLMVGWFALRLSHSDEVRRLTEQNLHALGAAEALVRASEERFRSLVQNASDVMTILDADGVRHYVSPSVQRVLGYEPASLTGTDFFAAIHPDDAGRALEAYVDSLQQPGVSAPVLFRWRHADGGWRWIESLFNNLLADPSVAGIVVNSRDVTEQQEASRQLTHLAFHDPLTGLANRALFMDRLEQALARVRRHPAIIAVIYLDLDYFKTINDSLGHAAGDQLLVSAARRLETCLRPADTVARFGGDEFTILVEDLAARADAERVVQRIVQHFAAPFILDGERRTITTSAGIAITADPHARAADLLRQADAALYRAKIAGRSRYTVFDAAAGDDAPASERRVMPA